VSTFRHPAVGDRSFPVVDPQMWNSSWLDDVMALTPSALYKDLTIMAAVTRDLRICCVCLMVLYWLTQVIN